MRHAIIIGSGIAGPLAAIALAKVGVSSTIFEAHSESGTLATGAWLTVAVNGLHAMGTLGVREAVVNQGFASELIRFYSGTGKVLGSVPIGSRLADGTVTHTIKRADLYRCVANEASACGARIAYGKRFVELDEAPDGVVARFDDGTESRGDFLIGADGVHSRVRHVIDPRAPEPRFTGFGNVGAFASGSIASIEPGSYCMVFGRRAFFGYTVAPSGEVWWFANPPSPHELTRDERTAMSWRARLLELFADDEGPMRPIIEQTPDPLVCTNQYDLARVPAWQRGRLLILGDAAHAAAPSSGQGVSMAAEDAVVLAKCLRDHEDVVMALRAFVDARRRRVERVVGYGRRFANVKAAGPVGRFLRDLGLPFVFRMLSSQVGTRRQSWLFDHQIEWGSGIASPRAPA